MCSDVGSFYRVDYYEIAEGWISEALESYTPDTYPADEDEINADQRAALFDQDHAAES